MTYHPFSLHENLDHFSSDSTLSGRCGKIELGSNKRINKKSRKKGIHAVQCNIRNISAQPVHLLLANDSHQPSGAGYTVLSHEEAFKKMKYAEMGYLLYAEPFGFAFYLGAQGSGFSLGWKDPVSLIGGFAAAGYNWYIAHGSNRDFHRDLHQYRLDETLLQAGQTTRGLIFIRSQSREILHFEIPYQILGTKKVLAVEQLSLE